MQSADLSVQIGGSWHAGVAAAALVAAHRISPLLIVGIDNAGDRSRGIDYLPVPDPFADPPEPPGADRYLRFVIDELMPRIDRAYPTARGAAHTGFGGSSYGAVIALYAAMARPGVFGRLLLESPSVGVGDGVLLQRARTLRSWPGRIVMGTGTGEGRGRPGEAFEALAAILRAAGLGGDRLRVTVQDGARHDAAAWASRLPGDLEFLFRRERYTPVHGSITSRRRPRARVRDFGARSADRSLPAGLQGSEVRLRHRGPGRDAQAGRHP